MSNLKKIMISLPEDLLAKADLVLVEEQKNRSELVREAITLYLSEQKKKKIREQLERGYQEMGMLNQALSEEGLEGDLADLIQYETNWR